MMKDLTLERRETSCLRVSEVEPMQSSMYFRIALAWCPCTERILVHQRSPRKDWRNRAHSSAHGDSDEVLVIFTHERVEVVREEEFGVTEESGDIGLGIRVEI